MKWRIDVFFKLLFFGISSKCYLRWVKCWKVNLMGFFRNMLCIIDMEILFILVFEIVIKSVVMYFKRYIWIWLNIKYIFGKNKNLFSLRVECCCL